MTHPAPRCVSEEMIASSTNYQYLYQKITFQTDITIRYFCLNVSLTLAVLCHIATSVWITEMSKLRIQNLSHVDVQYLISSSIESETKISGHWLQSNKKKLENVLRQAVKKWSSAFYFQIFIFA